MSNNPSRQVFNKTLAQQLNYNFVLKKGVSRASLNSSLDQTCHLSVASTMSPRGRLDSSTAALTERPKNPPPVEKNQPDPLNFQREERLKLFRSRKNQNEGPYANVKILHGIRADHLQNRVRWDDRKIVKEYFGAGINIFGEDLAQQALNNFNQDQGCVRLPKFLPAQLQARTKPPKVSISSVLEINPDQFETSLRSCSRRLKAEKYYYLQKFLSPEKWEQIFGRTELMKQRQRKIQLRSQRQQDFYRTMHENIQQSQGLTISLKDTIQFHLAPPIN